MMTCEEKLIQTKAEKAVTKSTNKAKIKALTHTVILIRLQGAVGVQVWNNKDKKVQT